MGTTPGRTPFLRHLLGNLRLSAIICAVGVAAVVLYAVVAGTDVDWEIVIFLAVGMLLSSFLNAWIDDKRERGRTNVQ